MTNFMDKVEALKKKAEKAINPPEHHHTPLYAPANSTYPEGYIYDHACDVCGRCLASHGEFDMCDEREQFASEANDPDFILELCDKALEAERLQAQIQKMSQAEDRLLATGEELAEKLAEGKSATKVS